MPELLSCPFCGGEAQIERHGSQRQSMIVGCTQCGCRVESGDVSGLTPPERWRWNRRAGEAALVEALENLIAQEDRYVRDAGVALDDPISEAVEHARKALRAAKGEG